MPAIDAFQIHEEPMCIACGDWGDCAECGTTDDTAESVAEEEANQPCIGRANGCVSAIVGHRYRDCETVEMYQATNQD